MKNTEIAVARLVVSEGLERSDDYEAFIDQVAPLLDDLDPELSINEATLEIVFANRPTASAAARALDETDRQARRVVAGFERGVRPETLRGRGVRLVPRGRGLQVARADPGSLDVVLLLGGLYQAVTSQPLSFALNLAALQGYGKAVVRAISQHGEQPTREITIRLPVFREIQHEQYSPGPETEELSVIEEVSEGQRLDAPRFQEAAEVRIPSQYSTVRFKMKSADGSEIEIDCSH